MRAPSEKNTPKQASSAALEAEKLVLLNQAKVRLSAASTAQSFSSSSGSTAAPQVGQSGFSQETQLSEIMGDDAPVTHPLRSVSRSTFWKSLQEELKRHQGLESGSFYSRMVGTATKLMNVVRICH